MIHLFDSENAERTCYMLHIDVGCYVVVNWYRASASNNDSTHSLRVELQDLMSDNIGTIILGDLNIHHIR